MSIPEPSCSPPDPLPKQQSPFAPVPSVEVLWLSSTADPHPNRCPERRRRPRLDGRLWGAEVDAIHWNLPQEVAA